MAEFFSSFFNGVLNFIKSYHLVFDTLDIVLVALAVYWLIKLVRDSRAEQLLKGFGLLGLAYGAAYLLNLTTVKYLLQILFDNALIVLVVFDGIIIRAFLGASDSFVSLAVFLVALAALTFADVNPVVPVIAGAAVGIALDVGSTAVWAFSFVIRHKFLSL